MRKRIHIFDTTLRDGAQTQGVHFSLNDKLAIMGELDALGVDYIEGGWPGANPTDEELFNVERKLNHSRFVAFGMTRKAGQSPQNDPVLSPILNSRAQAGCLVGKSWHEQVKTALRIDGEENLAMIQSSLAAVKDALGEAMFDAEHFFDGYKTDPDYALKCLETAANAGCRWLVLCDTRGGALPHEVSEIVDAVCQRFGGEMIGIHTHNDTENAVANSLAALNAGATQLQGTINGLGERCGNANLISLLPTLALKTDYDIGKAADNLDKLTHISLMLDERLNRQPNHQQPYVGKAAFAHKGGLHASGINRDPSTYEHIEPGLVGNRRHILMSNQAGRANVMSQLETMGIKCDDPKIQNALLKAVKDQENIGYSYEAAQASFELLVRRHVENWQGPFAIKRFRVIDERRHDARGKLVNESEATIGVEVDGQMLHALGQGNGPVNALDVAMRNLLGQKFSQLRGVRLIDYRVRILPPSVESTGTEAVTQVTIESRAEDGTTWRTVGVSENIIEASAIALTDAYEYRLLRA